MNQLLQPAAFAKFLMERAAAKDGYIMGAVGQDPKALGEWYFSGQYSGKQLEKALYWREHAQRVWDCQGLADGYVSEMTGTKVNVRARNNYATWCGVHGEGKIPTDRRVPGAAVFIHDGNYITHVGFLVKPVREDAPMGDWYVVEARGVLYGVTTTQLNSRPWNRWGWMTKYFDYSGVASGGTVDQTSPPENLRMGMAGEEVAALQRDLIALGYSCGKYGADGEFGSATLMAVKAFQEDHALKADGIVGRLTREALERTLKDNGEAYPPLSNKRTMRIARGNWHVRTSPSVRAAVRGYAHEGQRYAPGGSQAAGWVCIIYHGEEAWISRKGVAL